MSTSSKSGWLTYTLAALVAVLVIYIVFTRNYRGGEIAGRSTPKKEGTATAAAPTVDLRALAKDTGLASKGKTLFMTNCASCHGAQGRGDGDRAASLNPKPRNYQTEKFKFGDDIVSVYNTLQKGSPGTSMPSFALLPPEDVMAMAHYVRALVPNPTPTTDEIISKLPESGSPESKAAASSPKTFAAPADTLPRIPIQFAMERLSKPAPIVNAAVRVNATVPGAAIYRQRCANCHGERGEGKPLQVLNVAPYRYAGTSSLIQPDAPWFKDRARFADLVIKGLPGRIMPGNASLSREDIDQLYAFVRSLSQ